MANDIMPTETIDVAEWIDRRGLSTLQIRVATLCFVLAGLEGFDAQIIGFVAPAIMNSFHAARQEMSGVFAAGLVGLLVGSIFVAPLADRVGRKPVLVASALVFGVLSLATTEAGSLNSLLWLRFFTGLGLGGALPNGIALTAEYLPARRRAALTMAMFVGFSFGATVGGLLAASLIPTYGWQLVFSIGGVLPILFAIVLAIALPESIRYLAARHVRNNQVRQILERIDPAFRPSMTAQFTSGEEKAAGLPLMHLFREGRALGTVLLWTVFFMSLLDLFFISSWLPTVLSGAGMSLSSAVIATVLVQTGGALAALVLGPVVDKVGFFVVLVPLYLVGVVATVMLGQGGPGGVPVSVIMAAAFLVGVGVLGGQTTANVLAATYYPTTIRATGLGWALGIGRVGSIVGPLLGGMLIQMNWSNQALFLVAAAPALLAALAIMLMGLIDGRRITLVRDDGEIISN